MVVGPVALSVARTQKDLAFDFMEFPTPPRSVWSFIYFIYRTLHKWCVVIDEARQLGIVLIVKAAHITDRLGEEITLTEICREAGVVSRSISTVRYCVEAGRACGGRITENSSDR